MTFNFQRNPTPEDDQLLQNVQWPTTSSGNNFKYLNIGTNLAIDSNPYQEDVEFYRGLYETYGHRPHDTY